MYCTHVMFDKSRICYSSPYVTVDVIMFVIIRDIYIYSGQVTENVNNHM